MSKFFLVFQYVKYWLYRANEHSIHSPFLFELYTRVIQADEETGFEAIETLRQQLLHTDKEVTIEELGAGSRMTNSDRRKVRDIARYASTPPRFSRLLHRIVAHFEFDQIVELGTSLGLNTAYLSKACPAGMVHTIEGSPEIAQLAREHFFELGCTNIQLSVGNIDDLLTPTLKQLSSVDLVYIDANHRYEPTLRYFEQLLPKLHHKSLVVLDDIHWSAEMHQAWNEIIERPEVSLSIDLFEGGLLFFNPALQKEHYILKF